MQSYEANFLPPDREYVAPAHSETSEIMEGNAHFGRVLRALAEFYADEEGPAFKMSYEKEQALAKTIHAGRLVEERRAERARAAAAAEAAATSGRTTGEATHAPDTKTAEKPAEEPDATNPADKMIRLDELDNPETPDAANDAPEASEAALEEAELAEDERAEQATLQAAAQARKALVEANARFALYFARASVGLQPQARRLRREGTKGDFVIEFPDDETKKLSPVVLLRSPPGISRAQSREVLSLRRVWRLSARAYLNHIRTSTTRTAGYSA